MHFCVQNYMTFPMLKYFFLKKKCTEMAQWLKALVTLPEDLGSIPRTHMVAHNLCYSSSKETMPFSGLQIFQACSWCTSAHVGKLPTYINHFLKCKKVDNKRGGSDLMGGAQNKSNSIHVTWKQMRERKEIVGGLLGKWGGQWRRWKTIMKYNDT